MIIISSFVIFIYLFMKQIKYLNIKKSKIIKSTNSVSSKDKFVTVFFMICFFFLKQEELCEYI